MAWSRPVQRTLLAAMASSPRDDTIRSATAALDETGWQQLAAAAQLHGVGGYVGQALRTLEPAPQNAAADVLRSVALRNVARHMQTNADLHRLATTFEAAGIDWLVVKGPVLAETVHRSVALRSYSDLDVLVRPRDLGGALDALESAGARVLDRNWLLLRRDLKGEVRGSSCRSARPWTCTGTC